MKRALNSIFGKYLFILIIFLGFFLRFWDLGNTPPSLYWDEVSQGYNAYSILKTGYDEHHEFLPLVRFQAFGDYKAPVYIYLDVIPIFLFGQTEFAVRLPSALFGMLTVLVVYFLAVEIFYENKKRKNIALMASFFLAISPWHIQLSRAAYEANIATFFTVLGIYLFFKAKRSTNFLFIPSFLSFVLAIYSFNAHRIFVPLIIIVLGILYFKELKKKFKYILISSAISLIILLPFVLYLTTPESRLRFAEVNIFSDLQIIKDSNRLIEHDNNSLLGKIVHNRRVLFGLSYIKHYFDFFNPTYLFFKGDVNPRFSTQENGEMYFYMLPLIIVGFYYVFKRKEKDRVFLFVWFLLAPAAAATARETPHALRSETYIPLYELIAGYGAFITFSVFKNFKKKVYVVSILLSILISALYLINFLHMYFVHLKLNYPSDWQYGYKETVEKVEKIKDKYDRIVFSNIYGRPYIYVLWYGGYQPEEYWKLKDAKRDVFGFYNVYGFGKYIFNEPGIIPSVKDEKILYVTGPKNVPENSKIIDTVNYPNGQPVFVLTESTK